MYIGNLQHILYSVDARLYAEKRRRRRRKRMTKEQIEAERAEKRRVKRTVAPFIDGSAKRCRRERDPKPEKGLAAHVEQMLPRDSKGRPYIIPLGWRLRKFGSDEYFQLSDEEKRRVRKQFQRYLVAKKSLSG